MIEGRVYYWGGGGVGGFGEVTVHVGVVGADVRECTVDAEAAVAGVVCAVGAVVRARVVGGCGGCDGRRVHWSHILAHLVVVALSLVIAGLRDLRRGCRACELFGRSDGNP